jgi:serine protease Do
MNRRCALISACCAGMLCLAPGGVHAQKDAPKEESFDRITPIVRVVQKCQGAVVAFMNPSKKDAAMGTGVIVDGRGLIITNAHVVAGNKKMRIQLIDKSEHDADVLTVKGDYDLAVVRITTNIKLDVLPPCTSDKVFVGEDVIAIGHPFGYSYSITRGILSATGRAITLPSGDTIKEVFQIDAAINPGNSGGPLMNIRGELIGINFATRGGAELISFTIPAKKVREVLAGHSK